MKRLGLIGFILTSVGELTAHVVGIDMLHLICKPLIMIFLGVYYYNCVGIENRSAAVLVAIFFSFLGDVLLMLQGNNGIYFILGLAAFLVAHIFYIFSYRQHRNASHPDELQGVQRIRLAFPIVLAGSGLVVVLYPVLDTLKVPVMAYALTIVVMVLTALFRYGRTQPASFWMVFPGAVLFMVSDSLIAINKFLNPVPSAGLFIMATYVVAQFLIVEGLCRHKFANP